MRTCYDEEREPMYYDDPEECTHTNQYFNGYEWKCRSCGESLGGPENE